MASGDRTETEISVFTGWLFNSGLELPWQLGPRLQPLSNVVEKCGVTMFSNSNPVSPSYHCNPKTRRSLSGKQRRNQVLNDLEEGNEKLWNLPLRHLTRATHIKCLNDSTQPVCCHRNNILAVHVSFLGTANFTHVRFLCFRRKCIRLTWSYFKSRGKNAIFLVTGSFWLQQDRRNVGFVLH